MIEFAKIKSAPSLNHTVNCGEISSHDDSVRLDKVSSVFDLYSKLRRNLAFENLFCKGRSILKSLYI